MSLELRRLAETEAAAYQRYADLWINVLDEIPECGNADCERRALLAIHRMAVEESDWQAGRWPGLEVAINQVAELSWNLRGKLPDAGILMSIRETAREQLGSKVME